MATSNYSPYSMSSSSSGSSSKPASSSSSSSKTASSSTSKTNYTPYSSASTSSAAKSTAAKSSAAKVASSLSSSSSGPSSSKVSYTPSRTPSASLTSSLSSGGGDSTGGRNLRGSDPDSSIRRTGVSSSNASSRARSSANPTAAEIASIGEQLAALNAMAAMSPAERRRAERDAAGVEPSPGLIDWNGMIYDFNAPYRERAERAGGAPFEGAVDWGGIAGALFDGQSAADRDAALAQQRRGPDPSRFTPYVEPLPGALSAENLEDFLTGGADGDYRVSPRSTPWSEDNAIMQAMRGGGDRPLEGTGPEGNRLVADSSALPSLNLDGFDALEALAQGVQTEQRRMRGELPTEDIAMAYMPSMPRPDPRGGIADAVNLPGQVEGGRMPVEIEVRGGMPAESDEARYARMNPAEEPKKPTVWDQVVEGAGGLAEKTGWGSVVKSLFPDFWYGTGEAMKGLDDGMTYGGSGPRTQFEYMPQNGSIIEQPIQYAYAPQALPFPDVNGNGIDDRLEGIGAPGAMGGNRPRNVVFPDMPPFRGGIDPEWRYFRDGYAEGGPVGEVYESDRDLDDGMDRGAMQSDPRMAVIADAEDAIENYAEGEPEPDDEKALRTFVDMFGDGALRDLAANVAQGLKQRERRSGRLISGPGGPKDDAVPAVITDEAGGQRPAALSDGEFVVPYEAVEGAGDGDHEAGAERLQRLSNMLSRRGAA